jgi:hypothetical protein
VIPTRAELSKTWDISADFACANCCDRPPDDARVAPRLGDNGFVEGDDDIPPLG